MDEESPILLERRRAAMWTEDYARVEKAIRFLDDHATEQPSLGTVAEAAGLSPYHFQRVFTRWAGLSPKRFLQVLTLNRAKSVLADERGSVLDAALEAGLSGPSRLHDLFVTVDAVTPGEWKRQGEGVRIAYGFHATPFGTALVAATARGLCGLSFLEGEAGPLSAESHEAALEDLARRWPQGELVEDAAATVPYVTRIFAAPGSPEAEAPLPILLKGTPFQIQVWKALLRVNRGDCATYGDIAKDIGRPKAVRAVGTALGENPIAFLIPCHRIIRGTGAVGDYRWGVPRKRAILVWEAGQVRSA
jgi:AraC family transcriptional regulator of adaptative response/methylated-DNA-[protein]-cysteine methyltransferase